MEERIYSTYILTNKHNTVFYIGVSGNLMSRVWQHKLKINLKSFTAKYNVNKLVWYESFGSPVDAIACEKRLKRWHREWKINLVKENNPLFCDLSSDWFEKNDSETSSE